MGYRGLQGVTTDYRGLQRVTRVNGVSGGKEVTWGYRGLHEIKRGNKGLQLSTRS